MMKFCGRGDNRPGLLQLLEVEGPSSDGDKYGEQELEPRHKIFLSHSGCQKDFTEQLCVDLERSHYYPFFDKRPDSLPKGKRFPDLIFKAAQQCRVAVLILSEDFFTRSKWPMLELEAFVHAQKRDPKKVIILPVYLKLSRDECTKNKARHSKWVSVWRKWAESGERINVEKWVEALRVLGPSNGIEYVQATGEVTLREEIVKVVRGLVPPEITWSVGQIEGRTRICKAIREKLRTTKPSVVYGVRVVGIHGMGGVGKTTFCKVLCDDLFEEFQGKVCHGEMGVKSPIELQKQVLRDLSDMNHMTHLYDDNRTTNLLSFRQYPVFLALDNIMQESLEEAKVFLRARFHPESIVMVIARTIELLVRLKIDRESCLEMPELEEQDAKQLFLHCAAPGVDFKGEDDKEGILYCVRQCKFSKGGENDTHFHPLALKVLGGQVGSLEMDPRKWVEHLRNLPKGDKFNQFGVKEHPIFSVLRSGYDSLLDEDQLLFIDVVLFRPNVILESSRIHREILQGGVQESTFYYEYSWSSVDVLEWLSIVHKTEVWSIKNRLQGLKAKSLLENIGDYGVSVHDLYLEFAKMEVKCGGMDMRRWVWHEEGEPEPDDFTLTPSGNCWQNMKRFHILMYDDRFHRIMQLNTPWSGNIEGIKWQHFSNIVVLNLKDCGIKVMDLRALQCLRSLGLDYGWGHDGYVENKGGKLIGLAELKKLAWLCLCNIGCASYFEDIGALTTLKVLHLRERNFDLRELHSPLKLDKCVALQEVVLRGYKGLKAFPDLSNLRALRMIYFDNCNGPEEVVGLSSQLHFLKVLLVSECNTLSYIPGLDELVSLQQLTVRFCSKLEQPLNLCKLTNLQRLHLYGSFKKVLGFNELMPLHDLGWGHVEDMHGLQLLRYLQQLRVWRIPRLSILPEVCNFITLEDLSFYDLEGLCNLPDMRELSGLQRLTIHGAPKLVLQLPVLGGLVVLKELCIIRCGSLVGRAELPDLHMLTNLEVLCLCNIPIRWLPSLERLTLLREFTCEDTELAELPDLSGSILLKRLSVRGCHELTSVGSLAIMPALEDLDVSECHKLERLPDLKSFERLQYLSLSKSGVHLSPKNIAVLVELDVSFTPWDDTVLLSENKSEREIEARQLKYFAMCK